MSVKQRMGIEVDTVYRYHLAAGNNEPSAGKSLGYFCRMCCAVPLVGDQMVDPS